MAKGSLIGLKSGKLGDMIMYARDGKQGYRIHRENIKNPRTAAQMRQRAKMNLSGRISSIVSKQMIAGLGYGSGSKNRAAFMKSLLAAANVARNTEDTGFVASIPADSITFSHGSASLPGGITVGVGTARGYNSGNPYANTDEIEARLFVDGTVSQETLNNFQARMIVMAVNPLTSEFDFATQVMLAKPSTIGTGNVARTKVAVPGLDTHLVFCYVVPMQYDSEEAAIAATSFLGTQLSDANQSEIIATLIDKGASLSSLAYGASYIDWEDKGNSLVEVMINRIAAAMNKEFAGDITGTAPNFAPNYSAIGVAGTGTSFPYSPSASLDSNNLTIGWTQPSDAEFTGNEKLSLIIINSTKQQSVVKQEVASMSEQSYTYNCPPTWNGDDIEVYIMFSSNDGMSTSRSAYLGHFSL